MASAKPPLLNLIVNEPRSLDDGARSTAPGTFVELGAGVTHYEIAGPPEAPTVVLVHGLLIPYYVWDPTFAALLEAGFRVLRYDLYGRGYSDRPNVAYDLALFDRQLVDLLSALDIDRPVDLAGLSMGGPIAITFSAQRPDQVRKLCLIDPAGFPLPKPLLAKLIQLPIVGEIVIGLFGEKFLTAKRSDDFSLHERLTHHERFIQQMRYRGFKRAILSTLRHDALSDLSEIYQRVGKQKTPVLLIWGREDRVIPFENHRKVMGAIPHAEFHPIEDAGHTPHYEKPTPVNHLIVEFLQKSSR